MSLKKKILATAALTVISVAAAGAPVSAAALADADHCGRRNGPLPARRGHRADLRSARARDRIGYLARAGGRQQAMADLRWYQAAQQIQIEDEMARGSRRHHRLPRWISRIPQLILLADFSLLLYFFSGVTNVNWNSPRSASLAFAVSLAVMVTILSYGFFAFTARRPRSFKDHSRAIMFGVFASPYALSRPRARVLEYLTGPLAGRRADPRSAAATGRRAGLLSALTVGFAGPRSSCPVPRRAHGRTGHLIVQPGWTG